MKALIKPISQCATKRSDHNNGFFIQAETWGSCFHRLMKNKPNEIWVKFNRHPRCLHTYTKFPARLSHVVFHVYVNYDPRFSVLLELTPGSRIIGFDEPQRSGEYLNRSFLVLSPSGIEPQVFEYMPEYGEEQNKALFFFQHGEDGGIYPCTEETYFKGRQVQHMYLDQEGYQTIPAAAGGDKYDHQPSPHRYEHYEGDGSAPISDFVS